MELTPPDTELHLSDTCRLVASRFPPVGIFDAVASAEDLDHILELEGWTNDRISAELGMLRRLPPSEWVVGQPMATVVMAPFCHPRVNGGRFNGPDRGAWYTGLSLEAAHAEVIYHRTKELAEIGVFETRVQMRLYLADFHGKFPDIRARRPKFEPFHDPVSYTESQALGRALLDAGCGGILYRSVRHSGSECFACFRPVLVQNVRPSARFEYCWDGPRRPKVLRMRDSEAP